MPHIAVIHDTASFDDLSIPLGQGSQMSFPLLDSSKRYAHSCGIAYKGGLLYCAFYLGICSYHKLGTAGWTQPSELQPGFQRKEAGCTVFEGKLFINGGSPDLSM